jgi:cytochrome c553
VVNIARYPGNPGAGAELYALECAACHGADAYGKADGDAPQLAGQHSVYLKRQIALFASAERRHDDARDAEIFQAFGEKQIDDLLAWLSLADDAATRH